MALEDEAPTRLELEQMLANGVLVRPELEKKGLNPKVIDKIEEDLPSYQNFGEPEVVTEEKKSG